MTNFFSLVYPLRGATHPLARPLAALGLLLATAGAPQARPHALPAPAGPLAVPVSAVAQNVTVQLTSSGTATLAATSVNNGSTGFNITYTIQKVVYGQVSEGSTLTLTTPNGANFTAIRYASYGNATGSNGNYTTGSCNGSNSTSTVSTALVGNSTGSIGANNNVFGDPCNGTPKNLAVVAAYSADAATLPYTTADVAGPNYVRLTVTDGTGNTSTQTAQVTVLPPVNNALAFDGSNDYVALPNTTPVPTGSSAYTLEAWIKPTAMGVEGIIGWGNWGVTNQVNALRLSPDGIVNYWWGPDLIVTTTDLSGHWHHIAATFNGTTRTIYLDGVVVGSDTPGSHTVPTPTNLRIGSTNNGEYFNGSIDEVRVYSTGLTQAQVQADMYSTTAAVPASLKAYYSFDQGTAGGTNTGQTSLADQSGTGNMGTLANFALTGTSSNFVRSFPTITGISPATGNIGASVSITGTNLTDATSFAFNGTSTTNFTTPTSDYMAAATVPSGATTGLVSLASAALTKYNGSTFTVSYPDLMVSTFMQLTPGVYNNVTITGTGGGYLGGPNQLFQVMGKMVVQPGGFYGGNGSIVTGPGSFTLGRRAEMNVQTAGGLSTSGATGDIQVTGTRTFSRDATYNYAGSGAQITGSGLPSRVLTFRNYNQSAVTFTNSLAIRNVLSYYNGTPPTRPAGITLTLLSDNDSTASVEYTGTAYPGSYIVQRYVSGDLNPGAGYRHVSAPVAGPMVGDLATAGFSPVVNTTYNTSATPGTTVPFPTVFGYDQTRLATTTNNLGAFDKGFFSPAATTIALAAGQGYAVQLSAGQTFSFTGTIRSGAVAVALTRGTNADAGWALVGNPFAASYDLSALANTTGVDDAKYVVQSSGAYTGSYRSYINGIGNKYVALGQGFFTRVSAGSTSATLTLNSSNTVAGDYTKFYRTTVDLRPLVQLDLAGNGTADSFTAYAETGATAAFDSKYDAAKLANSTGLNLSSVLPLGTGNLAIDGQPAFTAATALPLAVGVPAAGTYTLSAAALNNLPAGLDAYLLDAKTGLITKLTVGIPYSFSVTAAEAQALLVGRFTLQFRAQAPLATVASLAATDVTVYPNPAHASFTVALPGVAGASTVQAELLNTLGQVVRRQSAALPTAGTALTLPTADLAPGVYVLRLQAGATTLTKRVVVQ